MTVPEQSPRDGLGVINDMLLGEILLQMGSVSDEDVSNALKTQNEKGIRFGEALVENGAANRQSVETALRLQNHLRQAAAGPADSNGAAAKAPDPPASLPTPKNEDPDEIVKEIKSRLATINEMHLGEILIRMAAITREQLEKGLELAQSKEISIGEALVQTGAATWEQVNTGVAIQGQIRGSDSAVAGESAST